MTQHSSADPLARVAQAAEDRRAAQVEYRAAILNAVDGLEGSGNVFGTIAKVVGVSPQAIQAQVWRWWRGTGV